MRGFFFSGLLGVFIALLTMALVPFFLSVRGVGFVIPSVVLLLMVTPVSRVLVHVLTVGIVLDSYALHIVYLHTPRLFLLVLVGFILVRQWLTNRSLYTAFALVALLTTIDQAWMMVAEALQGNDGTVGESLRTLGAAYFVHGSVVAVGFTALAFLSKRLSSPIGRGGASDWYA